MKKNVWVALFNLVLIAAFALSACAQATPVPAPTAAPAQPTAAPAQPTAAPAAAKLKVGLVSDQGGVNDKSFNQVGLGRCAEGRSGVRLRRAVC